MMYYNGNPGLYSYYFFPISDYSGTQWPMESNYKTWIYLSDPQTKLIIQDCETTFDTSILYMSNKDVETDINHEDKRPYGSFI